MVKITTKQFAVFADTLPESLSLSVKVEPSFEAGHHLIGLDALFSIQSDTSKILLLELFCEFEIAPDDWDAQTINDTTIIPKETLDYMLSQVVGVARGVIYVRTEGTVFSQLVLPPINVSKMIQEDMKITV